MPRIDPEENNDDADYGDNVEQSIDCPHCGRSIYEDSEQCPVCGQYLSEDDAPAAKKPWWIVIGALLCLYAVYIWLTRSP